MRASALTVLAVSLVAGGAFAVGAVAAAVLWPKSSKESARLVPNVAPGLAGASFVGSF